MAMTFAEWRATRRDVASLPDDDVADDNLLYVGNPAYVYRAGFIVKIADGFAVPLPTEELTFATLELAEDCLWREWCRDEINGVDLSGGRA